MSTTDAEAFEGKTLKDLATWKLPDTDKLHSQNSSLVDYN